MRSQKADVDQGNTHPRLCSAGLKGQTESFVITAQDQSLFTAKQQVKIIKNGADENCRFCEKFKETLNHLVPGCPKMTPNKYSERHGRVGQYIHQEICQPYHASNAKNWCKHKPQKIVKTESATTLWDFSIQTDRKIQANKPDITIKYHKEKACKLIVFPIDTNISAKEFEKLSKYKDLQIKVERMWKLKTSVIPIVAGALGLVKKGAAKHLEKISGKQNLAEIKNIVLTITSHILRKALSI